MIACYKEWLGLQREREQRALSGNQPLPSTSNRQRRVLTWAVLGVVGVVGVTISGQFLGNQSQQHSHRDSPGVVSQQPSSEDSIDKDKPSDSQDSDSRERTSLDNPSSSSSDVDYSRLEDFLQLEQWQEADLETAKLLLEVANREEEGWLDPDSVENLPCDVLSQIDHLWLEHSGGKFGFSVQKNIYIKNCGGKPDGQYDETTWYCFADDVGWRVNQEFISSSQVTFDASAPKGHLPTIEFRTLLDGGSSLSRAEVCKL
ncbi:MAG: GUN4 domain-containing protein [Pseudanabaenales cyanobacterium]|nr:GUN4 domain-containing protein [Pseudanabaenales cyanobacterium]